MEEENKKEENKIVDQKNDSVTKNADPTVRKNHTVLAVLLIALVVVLTGGAAVAAIKFGLKNHQNKSNKVSMMRGAYGGAGRGMMRGSSFRGTRGSGLSGSITAINGNNITVKDSNNKEYTVVIQDSTSINNSGGIAKLSDLQVGNNVSVRGPSNSSGQVTANTIIIR